MNNGHRLTGSLPLIKCSLIILWVFLLFCRFPRLLGFSVLTPEYSASKVVDAIEKNQTLIMMPRGAYLSTALQQYVLNRYELLDLFKKFVLSSLNLTNLYAQMGCFIKKNYLTVESLHGQGITIA